MLPNDIQHFSFTLIVFITWLLHYIYTYYEDSQCCVRPPGVAQWYPNIGNHCATNCYSYYGTAQLFISFKATIGWFGAWGWREFPQASHCHFLWIFPWTRLFVWLWGYGYTAGWVWPKSEQVKMHRIRAFQIGFRALSEHCTPKSDMYLILFYFLENVAVVACLS